MTTIACDGRSMACDGMITEDGVICTLECVKLRRLSDGRIAGFSGNAFNYPTFAEWLEGLCEGDPPRVVDGLCCMVLNPDGSVVSYDEHGRVFPERSKWAIGSGRQFALAAMDLGKSASEAVAYAATRDVFTGGTITEYALEKGLKAAA